MPVGVKKRHLQPRCVYSRLHGVLTGKLTGQIGHRLNTLSTLIAYNPAHKPKLPSDMPPSNKKGKKRKAKSGLRLVVDSAKTTKTANVVLGIQQQQPLPLEHESSNATVRQPATIIKDMEMIQSKITNLEGQIELLQKKMVDLDQEIACAKNVLDALQNHPDQLSTLLQLNTFLAGVLMISPNPEQKVKELTQHIQGLIREKESLRDEKESLRGEKTSLIKEKDDLIDEKAFLKEKERLALEKEKQETHNEKGGWDGNDENLSCSSLYYVYDTFRIEYSKDNCTKSIGIIERCAHDEREFHIKDGIRMWEPSEELRRAWPLVQMDVSKTKFFKELRKHVPALDEDSFVNAWLALNFRLNLKGNNAGEMCLQRAVCTPFTYLFIAAAGKESVESDVYNADEMISPSLSVYCKRKEVDAFEESKLSLKSDAAVTLSKGWDAFGVMEVKRSSESDKAARLRDIDRCALLTAATAIIARKCIEGKALHKEVAIPFLIATGNIFSLYVTTLDCNGVPRILLVKYPPLVGNAFSNSDCNNVGMSPSRARTNLFVTLAILLNKFKSLFAQHGKVKYNSEFPRHQKRVILLPKFTPKSTFQNEGPGNNQRGTNTTDRRSSNTVEQAAKLAAACGGMFSSIEYPFMKEASFTDDNMEISQQTKSPFYFRAKWNLWTNAIPSTKPVFLKVWKDGDDDVNMDSVQSEFDYQNQAFWAGVPVAAPVLNELVRSTDSSGSLYLVLAVEYIHEDEIQDENHCLQFCKSLMETVQKLHEKAGLLHCDIKPSNIRWDNGVVRLIDFGRAQKITNAVCYRGTPGFESPEILNGTTPCSAKTDAFAVGATILATLGNLDETIQQSRLCCALHNIGVKLAESNPATRWSLTQALRGIMGSILHSAGSPPLQVKEPTINSMHHLVSPPSPGEPQIEKQRSREMRN